MEMRDKPHRHTADDTHGWLQAVSIIPEDVWRAKVHMVRAGSAWGLRILASCRRYERELGLDLREGTRTGAIFGLLPPMPFSTSSTRSPERSSRLWQDEHSISPDPSNPSQPLASVLTRLVRAWLSLADASPSALGRTVSSAVCGACLGLLLVLSSGLGAEDQAASGVIRHRALPAHADV